MIGCRLLGEVISARRTLIVLSRTRLSNGVRVLCERMPGSKTVALGLWLDLGSRDELSREGGSAHFIEHMLFKGTHRRDMFELSRDVNRLGGHFNAFTTPEQMCLHATVISRDIAPALDILSEMLLDSVFPDEEIEHERGVILEEIAETEDQPEDYVEEMFCSAMWGDSPLGRPVLGNRDTVQAIARRELLEFWAKHFSPDRLVITVAGGFDRRTLMPILRRRFEGLAPSAPPAPARSAAVSSSPRVLSQERPIEQIHFCIGFDGPGKATEDRYALWVLNTLYGGGMGSRLFNEIRERRGLAYSIWSSIQGFQDAGCLMIRGSANPGNLKEVVEIARDQMADLFDRPPGRAEMDAAREQCIRSFLLSQESCNARMNRLGELELAGLEVRGPEEVVRTLEALSPQSIKEVARRWFMDKPEAVAMIGPLDGHVKWMESARSKSTPRDASAPCPPNRKKTAPKSAARR